MSYINEIKQRILDDLYAIKTPLGLHKNTSYKGEDGDATMCQVITHDGISPTHSSILHFPNTIHTIEWSKEYSSEHSAGFTLGELSDGLHFLLVEQFQDYFSQTEYIEDNGFMEEGIQILIVSKNKDTLLETLKKATFTIDPNGAEYIEKNKIIPFIVDRFEEDNEDEWYLPYLKYKKSLKQESST